jgi:hypothetical protein
MLLELIVLFFDFGEEFECEDFSLLDDIRRASRDVEVHLLVTLAAGLFLEET